MSEEKKTQLLVRIPEGVHKWLKANVQDKTISDFITELINKYKTTLSTESPTRDISAEWEKTYSDLPSHLRSLMDTRERVKEREYFGDIERSLEHAEKILPNFRKWGYADDDYDDLFSGVPPETKEYLDALNKLSDEDLAKLSSLFESHNQVCIEKAEMRSYQGDPDEVVYKGITRKDIYNEFRSFRDDDKPVSILQVAAAFKLSYHLAYEHVIPWMIGERWRIASVKTGRQLR